MKVLHLETGRHLYGGAQQVLYLLEALREDGSGHVLVSAAGSEVAAVARRAGHRTVEVEARGDHDIGLVSRMREILRAEGADLLHVHSRRGADLLGGLAARWHGIPAIVSRRVDNPEPRWLASIRYRPYARIIAISAAIGRVLTAAGVDRRRIVVIPDSVDPRPYAGPGDRVWLRREFGLPAAAPVAGVIAQLIERKGHRHLLEAMPQVLAGCPDLRVICFGRGPLEDTLRQEIDRRGLGDSVKLAGFRADMPRILPALDLVVHPALAEGLGVALLQAAAASRPVVAFAAGGVPEAVAADRTGLLIPTGDSSALATGMLRVLTEPELARRLGEAGRERVLADFTPERMAARHLAVYWEVLSAVNRVDADA